jgi:SAM-dependent methyltransferase
MSRALRARWRARLGKFIKQRRRGAGSQLRWSVDQCDRRQVRGWVDGHGRSDPVSIKVNGCVVASISPTMFRQDLKAAGIGDGRKAFAFDVAGYLDREFNKIELRCSDYLLFSGEILLPELGPMERRLDTSQNRWRGDEKPALLTWGAMMTADSLWDHYGRYRQFTKRDRVLEIGPGYGRILATALERGVPFSQFVAVDLSEARVRKLQDRFPHPNVRFVAGDVMLWRDDQLFDVIISSATFEHLYPDCQKALVNLRTQLHESGNLFVDFIKTERASAAFEPESGAYVRAYAVDELREMFTGGGFTVEAVDACTLGIGAHGLPVERFLVNARPRTR